MLSNVHRLAAAGSITALLALCGAAFVRGGFRFVVLDRNNLRTDEGDVPYAKGNYFVGDEGDDYSRIDGVGDFGVAGNRDRHYRLNINFGYYY